MSSVLFTRLAKRTLPSATGLMIWARREGLISHVLAGLSNVEQGVQEQAVRSLLLTYYQRHNRQGLMDASEAMNGLDAHDITQLTQSMLALANDYNWE